MHVAKVKGYWALDKQHLSKRGTPTTGAVVYSTRCQFSASIFQCYLMGIKKIVILAHEWEAYYCDEFRRAARLARELSISIEPIFDDEDPKYGVNKAPKRKLEKELYDASTLAVDEYDFQDKSEIIDDKKPTVWTLNQLAYYGLAPPFTAVL